MAPMKVTPEHLTILSKCLLPLNTEAIRDAYRDGKFPRAEVVQDLNKRYRWDLLHAALRGTAREELFDLLNEGSYYDNHLDTALRSIVPRL